MTIGKTPNDGIKVKQYAAINIVFRSCSAGEKTIIPGCGVVLFFLTSMAKVLIPATIFGELQKLGLGVESISALGALFMYAYAASQLLAGVFADRYAGCGFC